MRRERPRDLTKSAVPGEEVGGAEPVRILIVDDSTAQRRLLERLLSNAGYQVNSVPSATAALKLVDDPSLSVVICDWLMPGISGPKFCAKVRQMEREGYLYIIMLTSIQDKKSIAHALDIGADDFLSKPVTPPELLARVRAGTRIVAMQRATVESNRALSSALAELSRLYGTIDDDLREARRLQLRLLPNRRESFGPQAEAGFFLQSQGPVGGDLVGCFPAGPGQIGLYSLDVSGHGIASALMTARLADMFSASSPKHNVAMVDCGADCYRARPPHETATELNRRLLEEMNTDLYFTLCLSILDLNTGRLQFVQAGHPHPAVIRASGEVSFLGRGGMPVGLIYEADYETTEVTLAPGDRFFMCSDGMTECPSPTGAMLDQDGLARTLHSIPRGAPDMVLDFLAFYLGTYSGTIAFPDDVSAVMLNYGTA